MGHTEGAERGRGLSGVAFHAHLETQMADGQQNRFPGVRSFAHLGGAGGHTEGWEGRCVSTSGEKGDGLYRGARRAVGYTEGREGRWLYRGARRAVGYTEGREGRWAIPRGQEGRGGSTEGCSTGPQVRGKAVLKSLWKNLERGGIKWKNIPNFVTKRERR